MGNPFRRFALLCALAVAAPAYADNEVLQVSTDGTGIFIASLRGTHEPCFGPITNLPTSASFEYPRIVWSSPVIPYPEILCPGVVNYSLDTLIGVLVPGGVYTLEWTIGPTLYTTIFNTAAAPIASARSTAPGTLEIDLEPVAPTPGRCNVITTTIVPLDERHSGFVTTTPLVAGADRVLEIRYEAQPVGRPGPCEGNENLIVVTGLDAGGYIMRLVGVGLSAGSMPVLLRQTVAGAAVAVPADAPWALALLASLLALGARYRRESSPAR